MRAVPRRPTPMLCACALLAFAALAGAARAGGPATYALDPVHTRVMFAIDHAGFSKAIGTVSGSQGVLRFDPEDWTTATLRAEVPMTRIDLGDDKWNRATLADNLLDADDHPLATFVSTRVEPVDAQRAAVYGDLTLRGVTREVKLDVVLNALKRHPLPPFRRTVGFSATAELNRFDFGIDAWRSMIGERVELRIEAEATRTRNAGLEPDADAATAEPTQPRADEAPAPPAAPAEPVPEPLEPLEPVDPDEPIEPAEPLDPADPPRPREDGRAAATAAPSSPPPTTERAP